MFCQPNDRRKTNQNSQPVIMGIEEVMRALSISGPYAYRVIRMLNSEMEQKGYTTIKGKVSQKYFCEHFHCGDGAPPDERPADACLHE